MTKKSKVFERTRDRARAKIAEADSLESLMAPHGRWDVRFSGDQWTAFPVYEQRAMGIGATIREAVESALTKCSPGVGRVR